ncbi:25277_t:CDS:2, partial [Gigaspora margarita]
LRAIFDTNNSYDKKNSVLFISGEFILHNNHNYVHIKIMSFSDQQKSLLNSVNIPCKTEMTNKATGSQSITEKITTRINTNDKNKNSSSVNKISSGIVEPSPANSKANLVKEALANSNKQVAIFLPTNAQPEINDM